MGYLSKAGLDPPVIGHYQYSDKYEFFNNVSVECSTVCSLLRSEWKFPREKWFRAGTGKTLGRRDLAC